LLALAGCGDGGAGGGSSSSGGNVTLEWWSWLSNCPDLVKMYEEQHPNVKINFTSVPGGDPAYQKYAAALRAGSGAPDVLQIEYDRLPQFAYEGHLVDLTSYAKPFQADFPDFSWRMVTIENRVFGIPIDLDPMCLLYKPDILERNKIAVPTTWTEFADAAAKLHQADASRFLSFFPSNNGIRMMGLMWQGGATPFEELAPKQWRINFTSPEASKVMNFWGDLIKKGYVKATPAATPEWGNEIATGVYAIDVGAIWGPTYEIGPYLKKTQYNWKAAKMPQWDPAHPQESMWGGLSFAVTDQSKHKQEAAQFAAWLGTDEKAVQSHGSTGGLYGASNKFPQVQAFKSRQPVLGGQQENLLISQVIPTLTASKFRWSPWSQYAFNQLQTEVPKAIAGSITYDQALANVEASVKSFAKQQGFKVV